MNDYLNNPLLLIIDMQNVYKEGQPWECKNYDNALSNVLPYWMMVTLAKTTQY